MAMVTVLHALDFAVMRPLTLYRACGAQFQSQGLEALLNLLRQFWVIFDCPFAEVHLPSHYYKRYHLLIRKASLLRLESVGNHNPKKIFGYFVLLCFQRRVMHATRLWKMGCMAWS
jgi:hypothetical protein